MRIGRDHIASTYTIAFATAGASLSVFLLIKVNNRPVLDVLLTERCAAEVLSILVGSIGLVLAVPRRLPWAWLWCARKRPDAGTAGCGRLALLTPSVGNGRQPSRSTRSLGSRNAAQRKCRGDDDQTAPRQPAVPTRYVEWCRPGSSGYSGQAPAATASSRR